jgi:hypothetical protein
VTLSPIVTVPLSTPPWWRTKPPKTFASATVNVIVLSSSSLAPLALIVPRSETWPPIVA